MLKEWIKSIIHYLAKTRNVLSVNVYGQPFSFRSRLLSAILLVVISAVVVIYLPTGFRDTDFIDYIKDILAIFVGFFVTVLTFVYDKLDVTPLPSAEETQLQTTDKRLNSTEILKIKREHNYTIRFFYTIGLTILLSTLELALLIPNIFWEQWFDIDLRDYEIVHSIDSISISSVWLCIHIVFCIIYRFIIISMTISVFYYTAYCVSSLLQVLTSKKKIDSWI